MKEERKKYTKEEIQKYKDIHLCFTRISENLRADLVRKSNGNIISYIPSRGQTIKEYIFDELIVTIFEKDITVKKPIILKYFILDNEGRKIKKDSFFVVFDNQLPIGYFESYEIEPKEFLKFLVNALARLKTQEYLIAEITKIELPKNVSMRKTIEEVRKTVNSL